jgi:hypothetical protein
VPTRPALRPTRRRRRSDPAAAPSVRVRARRRLALFAGSRTAPVGGAQKGAAPRDGRSHCVSRTSRWIGRRRGVGTWLEAARSAMGRGAVAAARAGPPLRHGAAPSSEAEAVPAIGIQSEAWRQTGGLHVGRALTLAASMHGGPEHDQ